MTITPQLGKTIKALIRAHSDWVDALIADDSLEATAALDSLKQILTSFRESCPHCGGPMQTSQRHHYMRNGHTHHQYCRQCGTTITTMTPPTGA